MKIVRFESENFKRLVAVEITPEGNVVEITGKNGSGKSSVLDAIYVALVGRSAAPPKPVRQGEEKCTIRLDLGELVVTRTFTVKEGAQYTDTLKVENGEGLRFPKPQEVLDALLGEIGFDPFEFCLMKPGAQAETLLGMVPLPVDLDELQALDESDYMKRRDINRDLASLKAQRDSVPQEAVPEDLPDRDALTEQLGNAAETNAAIERERFRREGLSVAAQRAKGEVADLSGYLLKLREDYERAVETTKDQQATAQSTADRLDAELADLSSLAQPVDTDALREKLGEANRLAAVVERQDRRSKLTAQVEKMAAEADALTEAMAKRDKQRQKALAEAKMPIDGLGFTVDEKGKPFVTFDGVPFEQASTAEQLRASTAIAMAANPSLRVLRVKDGSLLDEDSMKLLAEMANEQDFQLWIERVGTDAGVGIIMENGEVKAAPATKATPKAKPVDEKPEGALV